MKILNKDELKEEKPKRIKENHHHNQKENKNQSRQAIENLRDTSEDHMARAERKQNWPLTGDKIEKTIPRLHTKAEIKKGVSNSHI